MALARAQRAGARHVRRSSPACPRRAGATRRRARTARLRRPPRGRCDRGPSSTAAPGRGDRQLGQLRGGGRGDGAARAAVEAAVGNPGLTAEEVERTRDVLTELGAVQAVEQRIAALTGSALDALAAAPVAAPAATELAELAVTATRRRR